MSDVLVVFSDGGTHPLSWLLRRGFRHVLCAVRDGDYWCVIDGDEGLPVLSVAYGDLARWYRRQGCIVVEVTKRQPVRAPFAVVSCVGLVKAVVGIRSLAVTPWGLYRHLRRRAT